MEGKKVSVRFRDAKGNSVALNLEGSLDLGSVMRYLSALGCFGNRCEDNDLQPMALIAGEQVGEGPIVTTNTPRLQQKTLTEEITVVVDSLAGGWFTSKDVKRVYEQRFAKAIPLSKVSTYLARLYDRGVLSRLKDGKSFRYRIEIELKETP